MQSRSSSLPFSDYTRRLLDPLFESNGILLVYSCFVNKNCFGRVTLDSQFISHLAAFGQRVGELIKVTRLNFMLRSFLT